MAHRKKHTETDNHAEEEREHRPHDPRLIDPDYLEHHDAVRILKELREEQMRPHKFPT